jgi:hypothetical protein
MENFGFSAADLQFVEVDRILRATSPEHLIFILARRSAMLTWLQRV